MFRIVCTEKPWKGRSLTVRQTAARLGARPDCDVALPPELLGGGVLAIRAELKGFHLTAEGGLELTVNRKPVGQEASVRVGDTVRAGRFAFTIRPLGVTATRRRRLGAVQAFALVAALLVFFFEIGFLLYLSLLRDESQGTPLPEPVAPVPAVVEPAAEPIVEPPPEPVVEPTAEPMVEPGIEPEPEPAPKSEPGPDPAPEQEPKLPPEPVPEPDDVLEMEPDLP